MHKWIMALVLVCLGICQGAYAQSKDSLQVYIFLAETCPICQSSTLDLKSIYATYHEKGVGFTGLFPSRNMSTDDTRKKFEKKYKIPFALIADTDQKMVKKYNATVTPEVVVVRVKDNTVLYRGRVDNGFESIGQKRQVTTEHYLKDALENILHNKSASPASTTPVGCYISKS